MPIRIGRRRVWQICSQPRLRSILREIRSRTACGSVFRNSRVWGLGPQGFPFLSPGFPWVVGGLSWDTAPRGDTPPRGTRPLVLSSWFPSGVERQGLSPPATARRLSFGWGPGLASPAYGQPARNLRSPVSRLRPMPRRPAPERPILERLMLKRPTPENPRWRGPCRRGPC